MTLIISSPDLNVFLTLQVPSLVSFLCFFIVTFNLEVNSFYLPVPMVTLSKARPVFDRSNIGIVGSNPARDMVCVIFQCYIVLCR